jgi:hypothetical protein
MEKLTRKEIKRLGFIAHAVAEGGATLDLDEAAKRAAFAFGNLAGLMVYKTNEEPTRSQILSRHAAGGFRYEMTFDEAGYLTLNALCHGGETIKLGELTFKDAKPR